MKFHLIKHNHSSTIPQYRNRMLYINNTFAREVIGKIGKSVKNRISIYAIFGLE